jgi:hypothetical protein
MRMLSKYNVTIPIACKIRRVKMIDLGRRCHLGNPAGHAGFAGFAKGGGA